MKADRRKHHIVYKTTCLETGRFYIGLHSTDDLEDGYLGSGGRLWKSLKAHGKDAHTRVIIAHHPTRKEAALHEEALVAEVWKKDPLCMNAGPGGLGYHSGWYTTTESTKAKISEASKAQWAKRREGGYTVPPQSPASVAKRVAKNTGKTRTPEQLANLAAGQQEYYNTVDPVILSERGQKAAQTRLERGTNLGGRPKGIAMSEEQKARQSSAMKGKSLSAEHRLNLQKPKSRICCLGCHKETTTSHLPRYHSTCT
jgi:hypothetical protein